MLACGNRFTAVLTSDGHLRVCGDNRAGQLGFGPRDEVKLLSRMPWKKDDVEMQMLAASDGFMAALDKRGRVWVSGAYHILPNMHCNMLPLPCLVPVAFIAAGCQHCMAICADNRVFGVGKNWSGQLGTGDTDRRMQLECIADGPWMGKASMVACGGHFSVILGADGALWSCGAYSSYCLGVTVAGV